MLILQFVILSCMTIATLFGVYLLLNGGISGTFKKNKKCGYICTNCGYQGKSKKVNKGSMGAELALWLFFIIPGLCYSVWRLCSFESQCPNCKKPSMIPIDSPVGQKLVRDLAVK